MTTYWNIFRNNFRDIIKNSEFHNNTLNYIVKFDSNVLLYGYYGFPTDLLIDEMIKIKFNINTIYRNECIWNKNIIYNENQYFFEIDLLNPNMPKDYSFLPELILHIIKNKNIKMDSKHFIIIKHIDLLSNHFFIFRILLERFTDNAFFLCTTHKISKIESPIRSRFSCMRVPLFKHEIIIKIFDEYLKIKLNKFLLESKTTNILKAIFIAQVEKNEPSLITNEFCNYNFPPIYEFVNNFSKKDNSLEDIRLFSYKCCQYNISIKEITLDCLKIIKTKKKNRINKKCCRNRSCISDY